MKLTRRAPVSREGARENLLSALSPLNIPRQELEQIVDTMQQLLERERIRYP